MLPYIGKNEIANCHKSVKIMGTNCYKSEKSGGGIAINPVGGDGYLLVASRGC